jgi:hypothetical protein
MVSARGRRRLHREVLEAFQKLSSLLTEAEKHGLVGTLNHAAAQDKLRVAKDEYQVSAFVNGGCKFKLEEEE